MSKTNSIPGERYSDEDLQEFKDLIDKKVTAARHELDYLQSLISNNQDANAKDAKLEGENMDVFQLQQMATRQENYITHLTDALGRIENKTYGICRSTGKLIDKARLRAVPHATLSMEAKVLGTPNYPVVDTILSKPLKKSNMQKFTVNADNLRPALTILKEAIEAKPLHAILSNILCKVGDGKIELITSNLRLTIYERIECDTEGGPFEVILPFMFLAKIVALNKKSPLTLTMEKKGAKISAVKEVYELKSLEKPEDFPKLPDLPKKNRTLLPDNFGYWAVAALDTILTGPNSDPKTARFQSVLLEFKPGSITLASSDGRYKVFSYTLNAEKGSDSEDDLLIPENAVKALGSGQGINVSWTAKHIGFDTAERTVIVTRLEEKYGNYRAIIPEGVTANIEFKREEIIQALDNCCLNSDSFKPTTLDLANKTAVQFKAYDVDYQRHICIDVEGEYTGEVEKISFNAEHMLSLLHQVDYEKVTVAISDPTRGMVFKTPEDANYIGLLIPTHPVSTTK